MLRVVGVIVGLLGLVALVTGHPGRAQAHDPDPAPFVGGWIVTVTQPAPPANAPPALWTFTDEGNLLQTGPRGVATGVWQATGTDTAAFVLVFAAPSQTDPRVYGGLETTRGTLHYDAAAHAWTATYTVSLTDPHGRVTSLPPGRANGRQITLATGPATGTPPATPVG